MARKHKHPDHVNLERWLVSYADFITLLFAFFVVMFAISQADMAKMKQAAASIKSAFSAAGPTSMIDQGKMSGKQIEDFSTLDKGAVFDMPAGKTNQGASLEMEQLASLSTMVEEALVMTLESRELANEVFEFPPITDDGLIIRLSSTYMFSPGSDQVKPAVYPILDKLAGILKWTKNRVRIEGHTDSTMLDGGRFKSNWELSAARSARVVEYFIKRHNYDPERLSVSAYADTRPIATNETESGRIRNRRIEVVVLKKSH